MAGFGAKYIRFNRITREPDNALPIYKKGGAVTLGRLVKAELAVTNASGQIYGDDELAESVDEFVSASLAVETDDMEDNVASEVFGCAVENKVVHFRQGDSPPMGCVGYYKVLMRRGVKYYKGYFYPRAKAALGNDSAQTKSNSITFGTTATTFTIFGANSGDWRLWETFNTEAEAKAWVDEQMAGEDDAEADNPSAQAVEAAG